MIKKIQFYLASLVLLMLCAPSSAVAQEKIKKGSPKAGTKQSRRPVKKVVKPGVQSAIEKLRRDKQAGLPIKIKIPRGLNLDKIKTSNASTSAFYLLSLSQVRKGADAIVLGRPLVSFADRDHYAVYTPINANDSLPNVAWSIGPFQIDRVLYLNTQQGISGLVAGQTISLAESVALVPNEGDIIRFALGGLTELKQNSQYVVFMVRQDNGDWGMSNLELGRFNTDGTDLNDEVGGRSWKEGLRQDLNAAYGVTFFIPPPRSPARMTQAVGLGRPRPDGKRAGIYVSINTPQAANSMLEIQKSFDCTSSWIQIANVPVIASALSGTTPVSQEVLLDNVPYGFVRCRIVSGTASAWSVSAPVILAP